MLLESILYKIFLRYIKEKNMSTHFFKCYTKDYLNYVERRIISDCNNDLLIKFYIYNPRPFSYASKFNNFCNSWNNNTEFNLVILYAMKPFIKDFLNDESVLKLFIKNLCKYNVNIKILIQKEKITKNNTDLILDTYINNLAFEHENIFQFINNAFSVWHDPENITLWRELNKKFNDYIKEKLLSKYKKEKISFLKKLFLKLQIKNIVNLYNKKK